VLAGTKLIAEAWDPGGLYQVGHFVGDAWKEWNGLFRDDVRDFFRAAPGSAARIADRLLGSPAVFGHEAREAEQSVNFVTCHDGFTLNDLVSYAHKRNWANGEGNRDGTDDNRSWNCGVEGPSDDPAVEALRNRQVKNLLTVTLLSMGVPMLSMGDEVRRTQGGNNNAYCQDNETSWLDWRLLQRHGDVHRFLTLLNAQRALRSTAHEEARLSLEEILAAARKTWHGVRLGEPDWADHSHSLALQVAVGGGPELMVILNAYWQPLEFALPPPEGRADPWRRWIDTARATPEDIVPWQEAVPHQAPAIRAQAHSVVVLLR
jgi:glycogen operon protein